MILQQFSCDSCKCRLNYEHGKGLHGVAIVFHGPCGNEKSRWIKTEAVNDAHAHFCYSCVEGMKTIVAPALDVRSLGETKLMGPLRSDGGPNCIQPDHLMLVRFPSGQIDVRETGPGRAMPDGDVQWRDLGHKDMVFPKRN